MSAKPENQRREASRKQVNLHLKVDPDVKKAFDYWRFRSGLSGNGLVRLLLEMTAEALAKKFPINPKPN